jgi:predicted acyltransferase
MHAPEAAPAAPPVDDPRPAPSLETVGEAKSSSANRIASLDQFRGYTVAGMLLVNFLSGYAAIPAVLKHHNTYCSYADTIMPQFFLAVGLGLRLSLSRRVRADGALKAYGHVVARCLGLILLGFVLYHLDGEAKTWADLKKLGLGGFFATAFRREPFQTLVHIGLATLWVLPVVGAGVRWRVGFAVGSGLLHLIVSKLFYYDWVWHRPGIDGGPLGFLTWAIPLIVGTLAYDAVASLGPGRSVGRLLGWSAVLMAVGYGLACTGAVLSAPTAGPTAWLVEPPFVPPTRPPDLWTMSQRAGSVSYLTFSAGFGLAVYALFVVAADLAQIRVGAFRTFGRNALVAYVLHPIVAGAIKPYAPKDAPLWYALAAFGLFFAITYLFVRHLEREKIFIRL